MVKGWPSGYRRVMSSGHDGPDKDGPPRSSPTAADLMTLYRSRVMEHARAPHHHGRLAHPTHEARGHNPLCGDRLTLMLAVRGDRIAEVAFEGEGCALSIASASMLTDAIDGLTLDEARALRARVMTALTDPEPADADALGEASALTSVRAFPARVGCVTLAWQTLAGALAGSASPEDQSRG